MMVFTPDYRNLTMAARNQRPPRMPFYEHIIGIDTMETIIGRPFLHLSEGDVADRTRFFETYCGFFRDHGYDTVSFEWCVCSALPGGGALGNHTPPVITCRKEFDNYPWDDVPRIFWEQADWRYQTLERTLPPGMKLVGGVGNGVFEISEDLVGFEGLCYMQEDDPELFALLYRRIGDLVITLWQRLLDRYSHLFAVCRIGDDMGYKSATLLAPNTMIEHIVPQYQRIIKVIHSAGHPFLLHSCGRIFPLMESLINAGINAKHSNEDAIAPYDEWIDNYSPRIGLFGGIDTDRLCRMKTADLRTFVIENVTRYRAKANGYAMGSGNSIPGYVPAENYLAMIEAGRGIRGE